MVCGLPLTSTKTFELKIHKEVVDVQLGSERYLLTFKSQLSLSFKFFMAFQYNTIVTTTQ